MRLCCEEGIPRYLFTVRSVLCRVYYVLIALVLSVFATTESEIGAICHLEDTVRRWAPKDISPSRLLSQMVAFTTTRANTP